MYSVAEWIQAMVLDVPGPSPYTLDSLVLPQWGGRVLRCSELRLAPAVVAGVRLLYLVEHMCGFVRPRSARPAWAIGSAVHAHIRWDGWEHERRVERDMGDFVLRGSADAVWPGGATKDGCVFPPMVVEFKYSRYYRDNPYEQDKAQVLAYRWLLSEADRRLYNAYLCYISSDGVSVFEVSEDFGKTEARIRGHFEALTRVSVTEALDVSLRMANENARDWPVVYRKAYLQVLSHLVDALRDMRGFQERALRYISEQKNKDNGGSS